jgi:hypothetical protein
MKKDEAKRLVLAEWRRWRDPAERASTMAPLAFYNDLKERRPDLLEFKFGGDKYQIVAGWVLNDKIAA